MKIRTPAHLTAFALLACLSNAPAAYAATATTTFTVTANVPNTCSISTTSNLAFGSYADAQIDAASAISVTCTSGGAYTVGLDNGNNYSAPNRRMTNGSAFLNYELYKETGRTNRWGSSGGELVSGVGTGSAQALDVFGRLPASQGLIAGSYTDTITATITYTP